MSDGKRRDRSYAAKAATVKGNLRRSLTTTTRRVAKTAERAYAEPKASTMAAVQGLGNRVADSASRVGTSGDWSAQAERVRRMSYEDWLRDKV